MTQGTSGSYSNAGQRIRQAYGTKDRVKIRQSLPGDPYPFRTETSTGLIGWAIKRKEQGVFSLLDLNGDLVLLIPLKDMETAKKGSHHTGGGGGSGSGSGSLSHASSSPSHASTQGKPEPPRRPAVEPRMNLVGRADLLELLFRFVETYPNEMRLVQFRSWCLMFASLKEAPLRYEVACKLYYFVCGDSMGALHLSAGVLDKLSAVLGPIVEREAVGEILSVPANTLNEAVAEAELNIDKRLYAKFIQYLKSRESVLRSEVTTPSDSSAEVEDVAREFALVGAGLKLTFQEVLIMLGKHGSRRDREHKDHGGGSRSQRGHASPSRVPVAPKRRIPSVATAEGAAPSYYEQSSSQQKLRPRPVPSTEKLSRSSSSDNYRLSRNSRSGSTVPEVVTVKSSRSGSSPKTVSNGLRISRTSSGGLGASDDALNEAPRGSSPRLAPGVPPPALIPSSPPPQVLPSPPPAVPVAPPRRDNKALHLSAGALSAQQQQQLQQQIMHHNDPDEIVIVERTPKKVLASPSSPRSAIPNRSPSSTRGGGRPE